MHKRFTKGAFGRLTYTDINDLFELRDRLTGLEQKLRRRQAQMERANTWFLAEITGNTEISTFRWLYSWRRVAWNANNYGFSPLRNMAGQELNSTFIQEGKPNAFALGAINGCEHKNLPGDGFPHGHAEDTGGLVGPGVDMDGPSYPPGFDLQPISAGVVVPMFCQHGMLGESQITAGSGRHVVCHLFNVANAHDGTCQQPIVFPDEPANEGIQ